MKPAISLQDVSKRYRIYPRHRDRLREVLSFGRKQRGHDFWALKGVSLDIAPGTSLGLLGRNGAGKSTMLQIISGVLQPTSGAVRTRGRISALLQLGAGFNPEFTGRENALMNGLLLGIERREVLERFDEIEAFADIGEFMDQPVKSYSSGMRARLGFAVAVNVDPDILLVDETLSVGDGVFRHMGIQKMRELQETGATIIFVSHSTTMVKNFCTEAALLQKGSLIAHGETGEIAERYQALLSNAAASQGAKLDEQLPEGSEEQLGSPGFKEDPRLQNGGGRLRYGTGEARIQNVEVLNDRGEPASVISPDSTTTVRVHVEYLEDVENSVLKIVLRNKTGLDVFSTTTNLEKSPIRRRRAGDRIVVDFGFRASVLHGPYSIAAGITPSNNQEVRIDWIDVATAFTIDRPTGRSTFGGMVYLPTEVKVFESEQTSANRNGHD